jgi:hypothetical protein
LVRHIELKKLLIAALFSFAIISILYNAVKWFVMVDINKGEIYGLATEAFMESMEELNHGMLFISVNIKGTHDVPENYKRAIGSHLSKYSLEIMYHSMNTLASRNYINKNDRSLRGILLDMKSITVHPFIGLTVKGIKYRSPDKSCKLQCKISLYKGKWIVKEVEILD